MEWIDTVKEIRKAFHSITNKLNIISVVGGTAVEMPECAGTPAGEAGGADAGVYLEKLSIMAEAALEAGREINGLKEKVYKLLNIDDDTL